MSNFEEELREVINKNSKENGCNTPDFILAKYLLNCLNNFDIAVNEREEWYGRSKQQETHQHKITPLSDLALG